MLLCHQSMKNKLMLLLVFVALILLFKNFAQKNDNDKKNWQFLIVDQIGAKSVLNAGKNLTFDKQAIYFSDGKGLIHSIDKHSGQIIWLSQIGDHSPFEISQDENYIYVASFDSSIYKLDKENGYVVWKFTIPNFFWPDTEVVLDEDDENVFFADRGGFLYAINKESGREVWKKEFISIDNSKAFVENTIHFGFISQDQDQDHLIVDHFPSATLYTIAKNTGDVISQKKSDLDFNLKETNSSIYFNDHELKILNNVIDQPQFELVDSDRNLIWNYQTKHKINNHELYQNEDRIYFLSANNTILESIKINDENPNEETFKKINFKLNENFTVHHPYKNSNPQVDATYRPINWSFKLNQLKNYLKYLFKNTKDLYAFEVSLDEKPDYLEFSIHHEDNFYKNKFTAVNIEVLLQNKNSKEEKLVKGFYFDKNTWKARVKLDKGEWNYQIKIRTPYWRKTIKDSLIIEKPISENLKIVKNGFVLNDEMFFPIGIQDTIIDLNKDGNPLNDMGYAKHEIAPKTVEEYNYLNLEEYLDIYKNEAGMNIFRYGPDNWAPHIWRNLSSFENFAMEIEGNHEGDSIIESARKRDYKIMMSIFAFYPPYTSKESFIKKENQRVLTQYLDYVIARYAAVVDVWELTNEALPNLEWQNFISNYIYENDPYKHPITTSLEEPRLEKSDLLSIHHYPPAPENNLQLIEQIEKITSKHNWSKASIISEFGFANSNHFPGSAEALRKNAWILIMQKTGLIVWNTGYGYYENENNGNLYLGPEERQYLKIINQLMPNLSTSTINEEMRDEQENLMIYGLKDNKYEIFYLLKLDGDRKQKMFTTILKLGGKAQFIDPANGNTLREESFGASEEVNFSLPFFEDDLLIKIIYD